MWVRNVIVSDTRGHHLIHTYKTLRAMLDAIEHYKSAGHHVEFAGSSRALEGHGNITNDTDLCCERAISLTSQTDEQRATDEM